MASSVYNGSRSLPATEDAFIPSLGYYVRQVLDPDEWLAPPSSLAMAVEVLSARDGSAPAWRSRDYKTFAYAASSIALYLLVDRVRSMVVLRSKPKYDSETRQKRYSTIAQVPYGEPIHLPDPFNLTLDTRIFNS